MRCASLSKRLYELEMIKLIEALSEVVPIC